MQTDVNEVYVKELTEVVRRIRWCSHTDNFEVGKLKMKLWWYAQKILKAWCDEKTIPLIPEDIFEKWQMLVLEAASRHDEIPLNELISRQKAYISEIRFKQK